jgi:phosphate transport system substrate-binding protein
MTCKRVSVVGAGILLVALGALLQPGGIALAQEGGTINGAGATFPFPLYTQWANDYNKASGVKVNYDGIGSGGGINKIKMKAVDFGASDEPLRPADLQKEGLVQFPMIIGGVVPVVNLPGIKPNELKLSPEVLAELFLGNIKKWDDQRIKQDNPGANLPNDAVTIVHRSDPSGTTWIFTNYLSKVSKEFKDKIGNDKDVRWPAGSVGGKGNPGVAASLKQVKGGIGYVEFAYAVEGKLTTTQLNNRDGTSVEPTIKTFQAAAANANWSNAKDYYVVLTNQPGKDSWPIAGASFILMHKDQANAAKAAAALKFFDWCYKNGATAAEKLNYVPLPANVIDMVHKTWEQAIKANGQPVLRSE